MTGTGQAAMAKKKDRAFFICPAWDEETVSNLGALCRAPERTKGPSLGGGVIALERPVHYRGSRLEHQMRASRRPAHLLLRVHLRWSPFFGQVVKLGSPMKDGPDDGQAEAVFG
jgi:hypothetical protein